MTIGFDLVTLDAEDPDRLATFWSAVLDLVETEREDGGRWIVLSTHDGVRRLGLQRGTQRPGSVHLDLVCDVEGFRAELDRVLALGGRAMGPARREPYGWIANLVDPEGNPFDVCAYTR